MTVVVGFVGANCAVMASDSEATAGGHTRYDVEKIWTAEGLLMGFSGSWATRDLVAASVGASLEQHFPGADEVPRLEARSLLAQSVGPVLEQVYSEVVPVASDEDPGEIAGGSLLVVGRDSEGAWLAEVDSRCVVTFYDEQGFQAIGSGGPAAHLAHRMMRRFGEGRGRSLAELRLVAYRTVETCIDVLGGAYGVGGKPRLWSCEGTGAFEPVTAEEVTALKDGLEQWKTMEAEALSEVAGEKPAEPEDMPGAIGDEQPETEVE